jgi:hypothetical protein
MIRFINISRSLYISVNDIVDFLVKKEIIQTKKSIELHNFLVNKLEKLQMKLFIIPQNDVFGCQFSLMIALQSYFKKENRNDILRILLHVLDNTSDILSKPLINNLFVQIEVSVLKLQVEPYMPNSPELEIHKKLL